MKSTNDEPATKIIDGKVFEHYHTGVYVRARKQYWARKAEVWEFDKSPSTDFCTTIADDIADDIIGAYLDSKGITEIEIGVAVKMWLDEREEVHTKIIASPEAKAMFDADEAEVGYQQACENVGIPTFLR